MIGQPFFRQLRTIDAGPMALTVTILGCFMRMRLSAAVRSSVTA